MQLLTLLLLSILIIFPLGELLRFNLGNSIYLKPLDLLVGLTSVVWFVLYIVQKKYKRKPILKHLYLFPLIGLISLLIHLPPLQENEVLVSVLYLIRWVSYFCIVFVIKELHKNIKLKLIKILFYLGLVFTLLGYLQYFFFNDLRYFIFMGWDDHRYRLFSTFFDPNFAGAFLVLYFIFVAGLFFTNDKSFIISKKILVIVLVLTVIAVFLTFSRSALVMLLVSSFVFLLLINKKRLLIFLLGAMVSFVLVISPYFYIENLNLFRSASSEARIASSQNALTVIADHPLLGVGFNSYRYYQQEYGFRNENPQYPSNADAGADNSWLFVLATTGIAGLYAYLFLWFSLLKNAYKNKKKNGIARVFIASASGLFINAMFINSLFFAPIMLWMWILYGLLEE